MQFGRLLSAAAVVVAVHGFAPASAMTMLSVVDSGRPVGWFAASAINVTTFNLLDQDVRLDAGSGLARTSASATYTSGHPAAVEPAFGGRAAFPGDLVGRHIGSPTLGAPPVEQGLPNTNRRIAADRGAGAEHGAIPVSSGKKPGKGDKATLFSTLPESSTWMMMIFGFAVAGYSLRSRRRFAVQSFS